MVVCRWFYPKYYKDIIQLLQTIQLTKWHSLAQGLTKVICYFWVWAKLNKGFIMTFLNSMFSIKSLENVVQKLFTVSIIFDKNWNLQYFLRS